MNTNDLYPVYIILFSNDTDFGKLIRKVTGSEYSHAVVALDTTMNNMYSFSDIPYSHARFTGAGFIRESLYGPMYKKNRFFTVLVTFVSKKDRDTIQSKIDYFCANYRKFKYNDIGLIQYYLNFKETKAYSEEKKKFWFCSEFVSFMLKSGNVNEFNDIMLAPGDIKNINSPNVINLGDFTIPKFKESDLIQKTEEARKTFIRNQDKTMPVHESFYFEYIDVMKEYALSDIIKKKKKEYKESDIHPYTSLIDWKFLYDEFIKYFPDSDPTIRFDLFELIVRKVLVPFKRNAEKATYEIDAELRNIYKMIGRGIIKSVDIVKGLIFADCKTRGYCIYNYPVMTIAATGESYSDIETMSKMINPTSNHIRTDMIETFFE